MLVLIPLASLIGVYAYATTTTVRTAVALVRASSVADVTVTPTTKLVKQIDAERSLAVLYLVSPTNQALAKFNKQQTLTNAALKAFEGVSMSGPLESNASPLEKSMTATLINATSGTPGLTGLRASVVSNGITRQQAISQYSTIAVDGYRVVVQAIQKTGVSPALVTTALQQTEMYRSGLALQQESDLYVGDAAAGLFPAADRIQFAQLVALRRHLITEALPQLDSTSAGLYAKYVPGKSTAALDELENTVIRTPVRHHVPAVDLKTWAATVGVYGTGLGTMLGRGTLAIVAAVKSSAESTLVGLILAGGLGLLAIIASVVFSLLIGRGLLRQLRDLRQSALELANDRLPDVMARLRNGQTVDVALEAPPVESSADEIDQVRQAFNVVQRTAIEAAVDEANLRKGVSDVFRNLARRSQVLLHRQLRLLDGMERRASEPEELEDLFRIDHLTTRMRRHAEGLIILSGESPGRSWRNPVPLLDVLRAAVAEVEDYTRIRVETRSKAALSGNAVADVIHLIAELAENATVFSPPNTPVRIHGDTVGRGFAVEVEDRGLGITAERLAEINRNLSSPPVFDLSGSDRLGLFIAGQLAHRHDIQITLRPSPYGGTTAIVIIPLKLVVDEGAYENAPAIGGDGRGLPLGGRHAALSDSRVSNGNGNAGRNGGSPPSDLDSSWMPGARSTVTALPPTSLPSRQVPEGFGSREPGAGPVSALPGGEDPAWLTSAPWSESALARAEAEAATPAGLDSGGTASDGTASDGTASDGTASGAAESDGADSDGLDPRVTTADLGDLGDFGLPTRVRQASLAPQLRETARREDTALPSVPRQASPEAARSTMAALQRGWELGRSAAADPPTDGTDGGAPDGSGQ